LPERFFIDIPLRAIVIAVALPRIAGAASGLFSLAQILPEYNNNAPNRLNGSAALRPRVRTTGHWLSPTSAMPARFAMAALRTDRAAI
jgi:hypothetical protein